MTAGMSAIAKPMPVPGNWMNARPASKSAKAAMTSAKIRAHGWSAQRPPATSSQTIPVTIASQPQSPTPSKTGRSPSAPNQSKPSTRRPKNR